jgi:4-amino-4-deoxy-L-arabinose transferase-like glycosyltransferase
MYKTETFEQSLHRWFPWLVAGLALLHASGLNSLVFEGDSALYAAVSKEMVQRDDWMQLFAEGKDWLDKPHFPFWIAAGFFKVFGFHPWVYKLPALLFYLLGALYTYRWANLHDGRTTAELSTLIYLSALHAVLSSNDVRAEPYLVALLVGAVYHFYRSMQKPWSMHLMWGAAFAAGAIMTKGIFVLIPIGGAFVLHCFWKGEIRRIFHPQWLVALLFIGIGISPELWSLYRQFDMHPEKTVFGKQGVSGLRFFFWDSQFGRFMNTGPIKGKGDPSFFLHTLLWAFLPWSLLWFTAMFQQIKQVIQKQPVVEYISISITAIFFLLFSASKFQLPHYMNIAFPFMALITARYILSWQADYTAIHRWTWIQKSLTAIMLLLGFVLSMALDHDEENSALAWLAVGALAISWTLRAEASATWRLVMQSIVALFVIMGFMNIAFYPWLMKYQSGSAAAGYINQQSMPGKVLMWKADSYALNFGVQGKAVYLRSDSALLAEAANPVWLYTSEQQADSLAAAGWPMEKRQRLQHIKITKLTIGFLRPSTRANKVDYRVVALTQRPK